MTSWKNRKANKPYGADEALNILEASVFAELVPDLQHRVTTGGLDITGNVMDHIYDELTGYIKLCMTRSEQNPNAELGFLKKITKYQEAEKEHYNRLHDAILKGLLSDSGLDAPEYMDPEQFQEFSNRFFGGKYVFRDLTDPNFKGQASAGTAAKWENIMIEKVDELAASIAKKLMFQAEALVNKSHGQGA